MLTEKIKEQIFAVRDSGAANMCNMAAVQRAAFPQCVLLAAGDC